MIRLVSQGIDMAKGEPPTPGDVLRLRNEGRPLWLDIEAPTEDEARILSDIFHFHPLAIEDCLNQLQRPKLDEYPDYVFLVLHAVGPGDKGRLYKASEFDIFLGEGYLVTFHWNKLQFVDDIFREYRESASLIARGVSFLFYKLLHGLTEEYFPVLDRVESRLDTVERRVFTSPDQRLLSDVFKLRASILRIRKALSPQREVLSLLLRRDRPFLKDEDRAYFMDIYDHILRLFDLVDNYHELLSGTLEAYLSSMSNRMNEIMKLLTIITTIMMPLSVIAGIYGMNFDYMPELRMRYGYPATLGVMGLISAGMLCFFRRKGWL